MKYPNCETLAARHVERHHILNFLAWCGEHGFSLASWENDDRMMPVCVNTDDLILRYFGIDTDELERERQAILDAASEKAMIREPKKTFRFVINGEDVKIQPVETDTMAQVRDRVLKDSHNTGRASTEWEIRDDRGVWVDPETRVSARADKEWFFLTIKAAFGGEG